MTEPGNVEPRDHAPRPAARQIALSALCYALPVAFAVWLYWKGLWAWFQQDDFAWLGLLPRVHNWHDLLAALFTPTSVQGSWRPLGERAYYLALEALFGPRALPFRFVAFLTQAANLVLAAAVVRRLTGSRLAGLAAAIFWAANSTLVILMAWSAEYILILCAFFLLSALWLFLRYTETGRRRYLLGCWGAFVLGFGANELNTVFPLLAASYALLFAPRYLRKTLPMLALSALYTVLHFWVAPPAAGPYATHIDARIFHTFWTYWRGAFEPVSFTSHSPFPAWVAPAATAVFTLAILGYAFLCARRRHWFPLWSLTWFGITLLPMLALPDHVSEYYLALPVLGLAMLAGDALTSAWRARWAWRAASILLALAFLAVQLPCARGATEWWFDRSHLVERWLKAVAEVGRKHPGKILLLEGVDDQLFWAAVAHRPFGVLGAGEVYLAPGSEAVITPHPEQVPVASFLLPPERVKAALAQGALEVYRTRLIGQDVKLHSLAMMRTTSTYLDHAAVPGDQPPSQIDVADPHHAKWLLDGWHPVDDGDHRWMGRRASLHLRGPQRPGMPLLLSGYCHKSLLSHGPAKLILRVNGAVAGTFLLRQGSRQFSLSAPLPDHLVGRPEIEVSLELDRTFRVPDDPREFGLSFGTFRYQGEEGVTGEQPPPEIDVADPRHAKWLRDGWYGVDDGDHQWMGQRAGLRLRGPDVPGMRLLLSGYCQQALLNHGPAKLTLSVNGQVAGTFLLRQGGQAFSLAAPLPDHLVGLREIEVSLDLDRTFRIPDDHRQFGLSFGTFELK